ncbi:hypothetical protein [Williamsia maris]|nr:hypothetical protein [Williamsia maris]
MVVRDLNGGMVYLDPMVGRAAGGLIPGYASAPASVLPSRGADQSVLRAA